MTHPPPGHLVGAPLTHPYAVAETPAFHLQTAAPPPSPVTEPDEGALHPGGPDADAECVARELPASPAAHHAKRLDAARGGAFERDDPGYPSRGYAKLS